MTLVRLYIVSGPEAASEFIFESVHTLHKSGVSLRKAYQIIRNHLIQDDVGTLAKWELSVVEQ